MKSGSRTIISKGHDAGLRNYVLRNDVQMRGPCTLTSFFSVFNGNIKEFCIFRYDREMKPLLQMYIVLRKIKGSDTTEMLLCPTAIVLREGFRHSQ